MYQYAITSHHIVHKVQNPIVVLYIQIHKAHNSKYKQTNNKHTKHDAKQSLPVTSLTMRSGYADCKQDRLLTQKRN